MVPAQAATGDTYTRPTMPFTHTNKKGQKYILHGKDVTLKGGRTQRIHYFAREARPADALDAIPAGYRIEENERTGLPFLKKG